MRAVVQRVDRASVRVGTDLVSSIKIGLLVLVGVADGDGPEDVAALAAKLLGLRIFPDDAGKMNRSVVEVAGTVLVVSQFTLLGEVARGRRPSFSKAAAPDAARPLIDRLIELLGEEVEVAAGSFGAAMHVELVNAGPVTLVLEVEGGRVR
jgi:D-tyrosyl-tRNA(Tyr) deacylase